MSKLSRAAAESGPAVETLDRRRMMIRAVTVSAIGTTIAWYDFFLYGVAAATVFPQKFFQARIHSQAPCSPSRPSLSASPHALSAPRCSATMVIAWAERLSWSRR